MTSNREELDALRQRAQRFGEEVLADHELLALVIGANSASGSETPTQAALGLLAATGGLAGLARRTQQELAMLPRLGQATAARIRASLELGRRLAVPAPPRSQPVGSSADVAAWFRSRLQDRNRESLHALLLDGKNRPITQQCISNGSWTSCPVDPKLVFSACLRHCAPAVILIHNHPSGDPSPSRDDLELTDRMVRAGKVIGIQVLDHLIVGREGYCSMADAGLL